MVQLSPHMHNEESMHESHITLCYLSHSCLMHPSIGQHMKHPNLHGLNLTILLHLRIPEPLFMLCITNHFFTISFSIHVSSKQCGSVSDGSKLAVHGIGELVISTGISVVTLTNVLHVPQLKHNVLSVRALCDHYLIVSFCEKYAHVSFLHSDVPDCQCSKLSLRMTCMS